MHNTRQSQSQTEMHCPRLLGLGGDRGLEARGLDDVTSYIMAAYRYQGLSMCHKGYFSDSNVDNINICSGLHQSYIATCNPIHSSRHNIAQALSTFPVPSSPPKGEYNLPTAYIFFTTPFSSKSTTPQAQLHQPLVDDCVACTCRIV